ncbi:adenosylcobinamide-phosphate synthase CbiB [Allosphingosinicella deserti]|uniref:Cobalamin biosynthesis protein CobD n=1 Tax=Allosphingosinicella deserti TaxID=2116704 RepID=A0A2P7QKV8_9SPHN|nr:adenosylcobinamide-phosphate synthase CbiB [Sphingomonas deserti]PSJ38586.1 cobalamin biosynthesis protein CobD [Sphingomonas deserti]
MAEPVALAALVLEALVGWPAWLYRRAGHPVGLFARILDACEHRFNRPETADRLRRLAGVLTLALVVAVAVTIAAGLERLARLWLGDAAWIAIALLAIPGLAQRSLDDHVRAVARPLAAGDLDGARNAVAMIVGRDTAMLDEAGVSRAAIESLAESFCDGIVAPVFWLVVAGLPGLWAYKAINTADSLIGHKEPRWRAFGWASARTDDVANVLPARLSGLLLCLAGAGGFETMLRDSGRHASPNAGWPEAAMAGALGVRLAGPIAYDAVVHDKPWIGSGRAQATAFDLRRGLIVYRRACLLLWALAGGAAWAL